MTKTRKRRHDILFVFGPSGVASQSSRSISRQTPLVHYEIDQYPKPVDGIDVANLRPSWNVFYNSKNPTDWQQNCVDVSDRLASRVVFFHFQAP